MVAASTTAQPVSLDKFPEKLGPMFVKELRQGLRARRFVAPFLAIHGMAVLVVSFQFLIKHFADELGSSTMGGSRLLGGMIPGILDHLLLLLLWLIVGIVMPLTGINALRSELGEGRNAELLAMAGLTRWQIMRGKWLVLCALSGLIMVSMLPYMLTLYFTGGVELVAQTKQFANVWIFNAVMGAAVIGASGFRNLLSRLATVFLFWLSYLITISIVSIPKSLLSILHTSTTWSSLGQVGIILCQILVIVVYARYGLQLGRGSLTIYDRPVDTPLTGTIFLQIIFTPIVVGFVYLLSGPIGAIILLGFLVKIDPSPDRKDKAIPGQT